jgi:hypothetical protein
MSDDDLFDESIQFIESRAAPPIDISDDEEEMHQEPPEAAIDEESAISAFSELCPGLQLTAACPVCFMAPTAPALTPW